jgi:hypothetical protein
VTAKKFLLVSAVLAFALAVAAPARAGFLDVSDAREVRMGKEEADAIVQQYGLARNKAEIERVEAVSGAITKICGRPDIEYHFYVINSSVVNAFAIPGGYIFLTQGIMDFVDDDDELASVIAHEVTHVVKKHAITLYKKSMKDAMINFLVLVLTRDPQAIIAGQMVQESRTDVYGRSAEVEADRVGLEYAYKAGYDPDGFMRFMQKLERMESSSPNMLEDYYDFHPPMELRKQLLTENYARLGLPPPKGWEKTIGARLVAGEVCEDAAATKCSGVIKGPRGEIIRLGDNGSEATPYLRAQAVADSLNRLLDRKLAMYEIRERRDSRGVELLIRNTRVVAALPGDVEANGVSSPDELMGKWIAALKEFLWRDYLKEDM